MNCIILSKELNLQSQCCSEFHKQKCFELGLGNMIGSAELKDDLCLYSKCICQNCNVAWNTKLLHIEGTMTIYDYWTYFSFSITGLKVSQKWSPLQFSEVAQKKKPIDSYKETEL